jgi:hypothetical protein
VASHRRVERTRHLAFPFRLLFIAAVLALGVGVLFVANGGVGQVASFLGSTMAGFVDDLSATPAPSVAPAVVATSPTLEAPEEPYTNQTTVDLAGRVPENLVGSQGYRIKIYVAVGDQLPGQIDELDVGDTPRFVVAAVELSPGQNTFTATIAGPAGESDPSAEVTYVLDVSKPPIKITSPKDGSVVNAKSVAVKGKTQARSSVTLINVTTEASVSGAADVSGAFTLIIPISAGNNKLTLQATDPAGNVKTSTIIIRKGSGELAASLTASDYQIKSSALPEAIQLTVVVTDPDGRPLANASVTFTLTVPRVPPIVSRSLTTDGNGRAVFTTTIPRGAAKGGGQATVTVHTTDFGNTTDRTVITITK